MFQVRIGREVQQTPGGKLLADHGAQLIAKVMPFGLFAQRRGSRFGIVVENKGAGFVAESFRCQGQTAGPVFLHGDGPAVQLACLVPDRDQQCACFFGQLKLAGYKREGEFARFLQDR